VEKPNEGGTQSSSPLGDRRPSQITGRRNSSESPAAVKQRKEMNDLQRFNDALAMSSSSKDEGGVAWEGGRAGTSQRNSLNKFDLDGGEEEIESAWCTRDNILGVKVNDELVNFDCYLLLTSLLHVSWTQ
jgi:hypothetical protein